ncbi:MAG: adenine deaminase [Anaerolineaceae bacterium]|nr:adenine deaminase [Anaerolineaceae bacterium]
MSYGFGYKDTRALVACAMGRTPADIVIRDGQWVCVQSGEILPHTDIAILGHRIAYVGPDASHTIGKNTRVIEAAGHYLVPGLLDAHMHVESGMLTVTEFVRAVIPHGTTGMFIDPHEIANVFGLRGVRLMVDEAQNQPIQVFVQMPSCVPSAPGLETPGETLGPTEVAEAMTWPGIIGLGEVMNFPGVFNGDDKMHAEMAITRQADKVIGGHYASTDLGLPFHGYIAGGPQDDHEGTRLEDAIERARQGMRVMLRFGSGWKDVEAQAAAVMELKLNSSRFLLCTDDSHSQTLVQEGHMDRVIRHAISVGIQPITALQMATINTAEYFGVSRNMGMIAPGRYADILLVKDLEDFHAGMVFCRGELIAKNGKISIEIPPYDYPDWACGSVHLPRPLNAQDFRLSLPEGADPDHLTANVIGVIENQAPTRHLKIMVTATGDEIPVNPDRDLAKIALVERHKSTGRVQTALVQGFGFKGKCAVASTVAHDSHHMIVVGTDDHNMALAANTLAECGGGQVVIQDGKVIGKVELPIAGLMSNQPAEEVARKASGVLEGFRACGCNLESPNMQLSLLALVVIPELRISDLGLVDVTRFSFTPAVE